MNRITRKILAFATTVALFVVGLPVASFAASETAEQMFAYSGDSFVASDWTGKNTTPTVKTSGLVLSQVSNDNYATVTYKSTYNLSKGFELTYSAVGRTSYNNIYDKSYYVGVKIGNVTVAMDQYVKPVIMVNGAVKTKGDAIISYSKAADIAAWLTGTECNYSEVKYTATYDGKTVTYAKYHNSTKVFEIKYTDTEKLINVSEAAIALYHKNSWGFNATYRNISLAAEPDPSTLPGGECGENAKWGFDEKSGTLYIYGEGAMDNFTNVGNIAPWNAEYRTKITKVVIGDGITHIGNRAFKGHNRITSIKFGSGITSMGYEVFYACNRLENIELPEGLTNLGTLTFYNCTALTDITIPAAVTKLNSRAFKGAGLTYINLPDTVRSLGYEVFMNCANLESVDFTRGTSMLSPRTFENCTSLKTFYYTSNMCRIRQMAFAGCTALESVYFEDEAMMWSSSDGLEARIASNAFEGCNDTLELIGTNDSHVETYAINHGFTFADKNAVVTYDLVSMADSTSALKNPDKGWYIHYFDNDITRYGAGLKAKDAVAMIPCLDHIYLRLAWSYLEPKDNQYNWALIDNVINDFAQYGVKVSFRITCKETDANNKYATPKWVKDAGANGTMMDNAWEPDYGDPIFLAKLDEFHKAFAERYDQRDDVIYVDVGSYGDWGEGHNASSSKTDWSWSVIKAHFDIYKKYYTNTQIVISDDFIGSRGTSEGKAEIKQYVLDNGWTYRDDSVGVEWFVNTYGEKLRSPELFEAVMDNRPTIVENEHYGWNNESGNWQNGKYFLSAMEQMNATYGGFHGYPEDFIKDNPEFAVEAGNKLGYWYFVNNIKLSTNSKNLKLEINWLNKGVSKAYNKYDLSIILVDSDNKEYVFAQNDFDNTKILPDQEYTSKHTISRQGLKDGKYTLKIAMKKGNEIVHLALKGGENGVYTLGEIVID